MSTRKGCRADGTGAITGEHLESEQNSAIQLGQDNPPSPISEFRVSFHTRGAEDAPHRLDRATTRSLIAMAQLNARLFGSTRGLCLLLCSASLTSSAPRALAQVDPVLPSHVVALGVDSGLLP